MERPGTHSASAVTTMGRNIGLRSTARVLFDASLRPTRALGIVRDITRAKKAEARLEQERQGLQARVVERTQELESANRALADERGRLWAVLDQMPLGVLVVSPTGSLVFQNVAAHRLTGRDLSGLRSLRDFALIGAVHPDGRPLDAQEYALARAIRDGAVTLRKLQPFVTADGRRATFEVSSAPIRGPGGAIEVGVLAFEDVTSRLDAEEALRRAQRLEAVGQLTGGVAHDFNNLLTAIIGTLEMLSREVSGTGRASRLVENAARAADRGAKLTSQLLAFARKQRLQTQPVDVDRLVRSMAPLLDATLGGMIAIDLPRSSVNRPALADPTQLELLVLNLAINARDAMPEGGRLTIASENVTVGPGSRPEDPPAGNFVALIITDTGTGMVPAVLARAFEPFFTTKESGKGSGLGLAQVLGVAQQLGGGVRIASRPGAGTTVTVYLPQGRPGEKEPVTLADTASPQSLAGLSILLVDDDTDVRETTAELLGELGAAVVLAGDGIEAIERVDSRLRRGRARLRHAHDDRSRVRRAHPPALPEAAHPAGHRARRGARLRHSLVRIAQTVPDNGVGRGDPCRDRRSSALSKLGRGIRTSTHGNLSYSRSVARRPGNGPTEACRMSASNPSAVGVRPRSVALVGPYGSGKSTLFEALLAAAGSPVRRASDARERTMSTELRLGHCTFMGDAWSILDCPGSVEFAWEADCALAVADIAVVVCEPTPERAATVGPLLRRLTETRVPCTSFSSTRLTP